MKDIEQSHTAVVPAVGTLVDLDNPSQVAEAIGDIDQAFRTMREFRELLVERLVEESERQGTKTLHLEGGVTAKLSGGDRPEYDLETLADQLRAAGLPEPRLEQLIVQTVSYRLDAGVARQLRGANAAYKQALDDCETRVPAAWRAVIERSNP